MSTIIVMSPNLNTPQWYFINMHTCRDCTHIQNVKSVHVQIWILLVLQWSWTTNVISIEKAQNAVILYVRDGVNFLRFHYLVVFWHFLVLWMLKCVWWLIAGLQLGLSVSRTDVLQCLHHNMLIRTQLAPCHLCLYSDTALPKPYT